MSNRKRVLLVMSQCDAKAIGESYCGYNWASGLADHYDLTVLTNVLPGREPASVQLPNARVVEWPAFPFFKQSPRLNRAIKPWYPNFYMKARNWMKTMRERGELFDIVHHMTPIAMRYPSPCAGLGLDYVIGPVGGALPTPVGFSEEMGTQPFFMNLRNTDDFRFEYDPWLRRTFEDAQAVIFSAPYAQERLSALKVKKAVFETEVVLQEVVPVTKARSNPQVGLRLLFVGRIVRTKGVRDIVRALGMIVDLPNITLDVVGEGEDLEFCRRESDNLGLGARVRFLGRKSHAEALACYNQADVFCFPSFREPTGIVLFEALGAGLPVIAADAGGPAFIVSKDCGFLVPPTTPKDFASGIAIAIKTLATQPQLRQRMSKAAVKRAEELGLWKNKLNRISALYRDVADN